MNKVNVEFGYESRGFEIVKKVVEIKYKDERDLVEKCLLEQYGSEMDCIEYWRDFVGFNSMDKIVDDVIKNEKEFGVFISGEESFFRRSKMKIKGECK